MRRVHRLARRPGMPRARDRVVGVDLMTDYYDTAQKSQNLADLMRAPSFEFVQADLADHCRSLVDGVDVIFHEAGQPGVRESWREQFDLYLRRNVTATARLLDAAVDRASPPRLVFASSSSV
jgi:UDP-glucuronate 4-epimerase